MVAIKAVSSFPKFVETYYTYGIYPYSAQAQRFLTGWLPISFGDILYAVLLLFVLWAIVRSFKNIRRAGYTRAAIVAFLRKALYFSLWAFVIFYILWGLNYSRIGIAGQLGLQEKRFTVKDLDTLVHGLQSQLNKKAVLLQPAMRDSFRRHHNLFIGAEKAFDVAAKKYPFFKYSSPSVKPSIFSYLGNYLGFQGYYNPFTGEAQVNTTIPECVEPFVATHEIAHQLGYAKESEANFVGYLACKEHPSTVYTYSVYFDMYHYAIRELYYRDSLSAAHYDSTLNRQVIKDIEEYRAFYKKYRNPVEPLISKLYGYFLKVNNQPRGRESYNDVVTWLIAYYKKYGRNAI